MNDKDIAQVLARIEPEALAVIASFEGDAEEGTVAGILFSAAISLKRIAAALERAHPSPQVMFGPDEERG